MEAKWKDEGGEKAERRREKREEGRREARPRLTLPDNMALFKRADRIVKSHEPSFHPTYQVPPGLDLSLYDSVVAFGGEEIDAKEVAKAFPEFAGDTSSAGNKKLCVVNLRCVDTTVEDEKERKGTIVGVSGFDVLEELINLNGTLK
jgi:hypothetical protein